MKMATSAPLMLPPRNTTTLVRQIPSGWTEIFTSRQDEIAHIEQKILEIAPNYYPAPCDVFNAFWFTPLDRIRVVLVGQDPYYTVDRMGNPYAMGLSFSVRGGVEIPPSLENIYTEIHKDLGLPKPYHGNLTRWAVEEGIFLLNQCLTVAPGEAGSHGSRWKCLIKPVCETIARMRPKTIFLLWGADAQKIKPFIGGCPVLETSHPSPMSVYRGFDGCKHFSKVNDILIGRGEPPIDWRV